MGSIQGEAAAEALAALVLFFLAIVILMIADAAIRSLFWPGG
jgi:uncharacterized membrane protein YtjA (UPF0391 family)